MKQSNSQQIVANAYASASTTSAVRSDPLFTLRSPTILIADHAAPCREALRRMLLHPFGKLRRATKQDCIEMSATSEVVTVCSWQFAGEHRLRSTAMILITRKPRRIEHWRHWPHELRPLVALLADGIGRRENAVIYRSCFPNESDALALGF